jgi:hypothetical protein
MTPEPGVPTRRHTERVPRVVQAAAVAAHEANRVLKVLVQESSDASQQRDGSPRIHEDYRARRSEPTRADSAGYCLSNIITVSVARPARLIPLLVFVKTFPSFETT